MKILSIETSCDETAVSIIDATGDFPHATYDILADALWSQIETHREYGGVYPMLAKREHTATIIPLLEQVTKDAFGPGDEQVFDPVTPDQRQNLEKIFSREPELVEYVSTFHETYGQPPIDLIAVTSGPGLEPALWVGVNVAKALSFLWDIPVVPTNHMEGHILASIYDADRDNMLSDIAFPATALLISGGHTELITMSNWGSYEKIGQTRDDAIGEAFDKVARLIGLPYPGGPEIGKLAALARKQKLPAFVTLPRPMLQSGDLDFSFSGIKTAVRYAVEDKTLSDNDRAALARDFEDAVTEVIIKKTATAVSESGTQTLVVGGGVANNTYLRQQMNAYFLLNFPDVTVYFPQPGLSTDNSIMIALAGHARANNPLSPAGATAIRADGNKALA